MRIVDAMWTPECNLLGVLCNCGEPFSHRADRWVVRCPSCGLYGHIEILRKEYTHRMNKEKKDEEVSSDMDPA